MPCDIQGWTTSDYATWLEDTPTNTLLGAQVTAAGLASRGPHTWYLLAGPKPSSCPRCRRHGNVRRISRPRLGSPDLRSADVTLA
jgi:hypothetical protein